MVKVEGKMPLSVSEAYKILGLKEDASSVEIKKKHHKLAMETHTDKGAVDPEAIKEINNARDVILNWKEENSKPNSAKIESIKAKDKLFLGNAVTGTIEKQIPTGNVQKTVQTGDQSHLSLATSEGEPVNNKKDIVLFGGKRDEAKKKVEYHVDENVIADIKAQNGHHSTNLKTPKMTTQNQEQGAFLFSNLANKIKI